MKYYRIYRLGGTISGAAIDGGGVISNNSGGVISSRVKALAPTFAAAITKSLLACCKSANLL